jgi:hypothetical protein
MDLPIARLAVVPHACLAVCHSGFFARVACVYVLQLLTLEDWEVVLAKLVAATNWGSAVYLLSWILIGHYVLLTLFMAVILEAFECMYDGATVEELAYAGAATRAALMPGQSTQTGAGKVIPSTLLMPCLSCHVPHIQGPSCQDPAEPGSQQSMMGVVGT